MYRIRYYEQCYHPDEFKDGTWLGWWIRLLNRMRYSLEVHIQRCVVRRLGKIAGLPQRELAEVQRRFDLDVQAERLEMATTSPLAPTVAVSLPGREERYEAGSFRSLFSAATGELPTRPSSIDALAARFGHSTIRSRRYAKGRTRPLVWGDDDIEAVPQGERK